MGVVVRLRGGGVDKATSVSDTNMAPSQHQYYVCAPSFSASHGAVEPPSLARARPAPFPFPTEPVLCLHSALSKLLFWLKEVVVWPDGSVFSSDSTLSGSVGRMLVGALSGFKSGVVESSRLEGGLGRQQV